MEYSAAVRKNNVLKLVYTLMVMETIMLMKRARDRGYT